MALYGELLFVFIAGLITALATGVGALPFFFMDEFSDRGYVALWGAASGMMVSASLFGLVDEGLAEGGLFEVGVGLVLGVVLVIIAHDLLMDYDFDPREYEEADFKKLVLILGILTVHSFPEGIAIGVSFADLNLEGGVMVLGFAVPLLAVFMTIAISIHNVPEGTAISIPLRAMGVSKTRMVWWSVFSSLPQPIGAVIAYVFVRLARVVLPYGFGFAAGAMIYLVASEFIPEALETGRDLRRGGKPELIAGFLGGVLFMTPLLFI